MAEEAELAGTQAVVPAFASEDLQEMMDKFTPEAWSELRACYGEDVADETVARFLIARNGSVERAKEMLDRHLVWRAANLPVLDHEVPKELNQGAYVIRGHDRRGYPIIWYRVKINDPETRDLEEACRMMVYALEHAIATLDETKSKVTVVLDRSELTRNADMELTKRAAALMSVNMPERLKTCYIFPTGFVYYALWSVAKWFFDPVTRSKVVPLMDATGLFEYIDASQTPAELGGEADYYAIPAEELFQPQTYSPEEVEGIMARRAAAAEERPSVGNI